MNKTDDRTELNMLATRIFAKNWDDLDADARRVLTRVSIRQPISRDVSAVPADSLTLGQRAADKVAKFGGSWMFILFSLTILLVWISINGLWLGAARAFDPFPFILLNLFLSMLAALQAPIIMMSQNRQSEKDRTAAAHDYEVNLKAEVEIMALHDKLEQMRGQELKLILQHIEALTRQMKPAPHA
jgi:uncharacterized membrane protein